MNDTLNGWLELVDASSILRAQDVDAQLQGMCKLDPENLICEGVVWNPDFSMPLSASFMYWNAVPPAWEEILDGVASHLQAGEYLVFDEKVRASLGRGWSNRTLIVSQSGVGYLTAEVLKDQLLLQLVDDTPKVEEDALDIEPHRVKSEEPLDL